MRTHKRYKRIRYYIVLGVRVLLLVLVLYMIWCIIAHGNTLESENEDSENNVEVVQDIKPLTVEEQLEKYADKHGFSVTEYPEDLVERAKKNPETLEFVQKYPLMKGTFSTEALAELEKDDRVPLLMQWDERWGYYQYNGNVMGLTGCGPTCLSMVASYLLRDPELTPLFMADYANRNGYAVEGSGTSWSFMSQGARSLGLNPQEVPLDEQIVKRYLQEGHPIICIVGEGIFTDSGHFIVFVNWEDGKIRLNDPNSRKLSETLWEFEEIKDQIKNMWVYLRKKENSF